MAYGLLEASGTYAAKINPSTAFLAGNSSISLAGSEEQIILFQQSPKMLKIVSENFIHALLLFLGLFLKISRWVPLRSFAV